MRGERGTDSGDRTRARRHDGALRASVLASGGSLALALVAASCADAPVVPEDDDPPVAVIRASVHAVGGGDVSPLRATWRTLSGTTTSSATVGPDGSFSIGGDAGDPFGELLIDADPPRAFHPFLYPFHVDSLDDVDIAMVPLQWTVRNGEYQGQVVETSLDPVMEDDAGNFLYTYFFGQGDPRADPTRYLVDLATWPIDRLPARVAFDRQGGVNPVSAQDSSAVWSVLERMEELFGLDLFEPAIADPAWWPDPWSSEDPGFIPGVIRVVLDPPAWHGLPLGEETPEVWDQELGGWAAIGRFSAFRVRTRLLDGGLLIVGDFQPLQLADGLIPWETVLVHEVLHVLGLGHTCRVPSPQGPCMRTAEVSAHDVAYTELLRELVRLQREHETNLGLMPATIGERRVLLELPSLPTLPPGS